MKSITAKDKQFHSSMIQLGKERPKYCFINFRESEVKEIYGPESGAYENVHKAIAAMRSDLDDIAAGMGYKPSDIFVPCIVSLEEQISKLWYGRVREMDVNVIKVKLEEVKE